jgi:hypothetical protein
MKTKLFRMLDESGEVTWQGQAYDVDHAEERCFFDESPGSLERFTLQRWGRVKLSRSITSDGWVTIYKNQCLAIF